MRPWGCSAYCSLPFLCRLILKRPRLAAPGLIVAAKTPSLELTLSLSFAVKLLRLGSSMLGLLKFRTPNVFDGVIGDPLLDSTSLREALCKADISILGSPPGTFKLRILFCMCSFLGLPIGERASSLLFRSFNSGRKLDWFADMLTLFCRLLLRTCSRLMFFFTRTSGIYCCMLLKRLVLSHPLWLPTLCPRLDYRRLGLLPRERPRTIRGEAISRILWARWSTAFSSSYAIWRCRYLRFMLKKLREQGNISWSTRMMLVNISDVTF